MTTPAPDPLAPLVARVSEAPPNLLGEQLFQRLLRHRIVVLGQQVDDDLANRICAELILLAAEEVLDQAAGETLDEADLEALEEADLEALDETDGDSDSGDGEDPQPAS